MTLSNTDLRLVSSISRRAIPGFTPAYTNYADLVSRMTDHPFTAEVVGTDSDDNSIYRMSYGSTDLPVFFITACVHGSETKAADMTVEFLRRWAESSGSEFVWLRQKYRCVALPCCCPYGYDNLDYLNANDVNINRNFDNRWAEYDDSGSPQNYKGTSAFSEPESQVARDQFLLAEPLVAVDIHTSTESCGFDVNAAVNGALYRPYVQPIEDSLFALIDTPAITYSVGAAPTASGWYGTQDSDGGYKCLSTIIEMQSDAADDEVITSYGMMAMYLMGVQARKLFNLKAKLA